MNSPTRLWGGRFRKSPDSRLLAVAIADASHIRLAEHDIVGSRAHAAALFEAGLLSSKELRHLVSALDAIGVEIAEGRLRMAADDEDLHSFLEQALIARTGALGAKLRAGRSRNDQAANDLKLYLRQASRTIAGALSAFIDALVGRAAGEVDTVCPGLTHLQPAQPVSFGFWLMAHAEALLRDLDRIGDWRRRSGICPLGAAALAGSAITRNPAAIAEQLGYDRAFANAADAVAARDHVAEFLFVCAMTMTDLSRLAEEITLWSSAQFGWIALDDAFATGSSIMPQKKNPDIAELTRGRAARLIGDLVTMLGALKGLPLTYNRDLGEDKRAAFDAVDVLGAVLPAFTGLVETMQIKASRMRADAEDGFTLATEVADYLALKGVPFAEAHEVTGALVRACEDAGRTFADLDVATLRAVDRRLDADLLPRLTVDAALAARDRPGGTAPARVREAIADFRTRHREIAAS